MVPWLFKYLLYGLLSFVMAMLSTPDVSLSELQPLLSTLQNVSAAVFTLAGIWIAYMYPEAIVAFTRTENVSLMRNKQNVRRVKDLVLVVFGSAFVLVCIVFINLASSLFSGIEVVIENLYWMRKFLVMLVTFISFVQLNAIMSIMMNNIKFIDRLYRLQTEKEVNDDL